MGYSKPIWNKVTACIYSSNKSFGAKDTSQTEVFVGSSAKNSYSFANIMTTRRFMNHEKWGKVCVFKFSVDNVVLKEMYFVDNNGKAGKLIGERNFIKELKGA